MHLKPDQGDGIERKRMGVEAGTVDFGHLTARNRLIKEVVAPAVDALLAAAKSDHIIDSKTTYTIQILITSEREISIN